MIIQHKLSRTNCHFCLSKLSNHFPIVGHIFWQKTAANRIFHKTPILVVLFTYSLKELILLVAAISVLHNAPQIPHGK